MHANKNDTQVYYFHGAKGLLSSLNQRLFAIKRIKQQIPQNHLTKVVHSLWISKLRYGIQLCNKVRLTDSDPTNGEMKSLQTAQNELMRMMDNSRTEDRIPIKTLLEKFKLQSVNQIAASTKLTETWKIMNGKSPLSLIQDNMNPITHGRVVRAGTTRLWKENCRSKQASKSFTIDAARLWNKAPQEIKNALTINEAKKAIKKYCNNLPI